MRRTATAKGEENHNCSGGNGNDNTGHHRATVGRAASTTIVSGGRDGSGGGGRGWGSGDESTIDTSSAGNRAIELEDLVKELNIAIVVGGNLGTGVDSVELKRCNCRIIIGAWAVALVAGGWAITWEQEAAIVAESLVFDELAGELR